ncbi:MAG: hypothetical protein L6V90_11495 [Treponema succinifaciens]|nr:MAG: hypothetical protein L6V90_11495 [Treponema succinifaciens]
MPDITTTVSGEVVAAGKDALPDFSKIVPDDKKVDSVLPVFAEENVSFDEEPVADFSLFGEAKAIFLRKDLLEADSREILSEIFFCL